MVQSQRELTALLNQIWVNMHPSESYLCGEGCEFLFVDSPLIDGVRNRQIDEFTVAKNERKRHQGLEYENEGTIRGKRK